jgi:hypothetical protein
MSRRTVVLAVLAGCGLSLLALGATGAVAAELTAVTCVEALEGPGTGTFSSSLCEPPETEEGDYETAPLPTNQLTEIEGEAIGETRLTFPFEGKEYVITCQALHTSGLITNIEEGGEMKVHGTEAVFHYTECEAGLKSNTSLKCAVQNLLGETAVGTLLTPPLTSLSGSEHKVTFYPESVEELLPFFEFQVLKGKCIGTTITVKAVGTLVGIASTKDPSQLVFSPELDEGDLTVGGPHVTYEATHVSWMRESEIPVGLKTL